MMKSKMVFLNVVVILLNRKKMKQWAMRITAYADRLIDGLNEVDWSDALKEQQRNWIGRSTGASVKFKVDASTVQENAPEFIEVFTTRVDTTASHVLCVDT
eukprot:Opistho-2@37805